MFVASDLGSSKSLFGLFFHNLPCYLFGHFGLGCSFDVDSFVAGSPVDPKSHPAIRPSPPAGDVHGDVPLQSAIRALCPEDSRPPAASADLSHHTGRIWE